MTKNWINSDNNTINKLKLKLKSKKTELETKLAEGETLKTEKAKLEKEEKVFNDRLSEIEKEIVEIDSKKALVKEDYEDLETNAKPLYNAWITTYQPRKKIDDWFKANKDDENSNRVKVKINGNEEFIITHSFKDFLAAFAWQIGQIKDSEFSAHIGKVETDTTKQASLLAFLKTLRTSQTDRITNTKVASRGNETVYTFGWEIDYKVDTDGNMVNNSPPTAMFNFASFFDFVLAIAPAHNLTFIEEINKINTDIVKTDVKSFTRTRDIPATAQEKLNHFGTTEAGNFYFSKPYSEAIKKEIKNGLKDWCLLFHEILSEPKTRYLINRAYNGDASKGVGVNPMEQYIIDLKAGGDIETNYSYERDKIGGSGKERIYCVGDITKTINEKKILEQQLESKKDLKKTELTDQNKALFEHQKKVRAEADKIVAKSAEIQTLIDAEIVAKQAEIDKTDFTKSDFEWTNPTNILKAAATKQMLLDIRFLENEGDDTKPLKNAKNQQMWDIIETNQGNATGWNSVIKTWFEGKGTDLASRIAKVKEEAATSGIGLEVVRECYVAMGDTAVVEAIDKELKPEPVPTTKLTKEDLNTVLGIADASDDMVSKWESLSGDWGKNKGNIEGVINPHISDATKKGKLIEHIKKLGDSDIDAKTTDEDKLSAFFKKEPKLIIETIVAHELEDEPTKTALIKEMKEWKSTDGKNKLSDDYLDSSGEPTEAGMKKFLYEKKLGKNYSTKAITTEKTPADKTENTSWFVFGDGNYRPYITYIGGAVVLIAAGMTVFWQNIKDWWNGPIEEEGKTDEEDDKEETEK